MSTTENGWTKEYPSLRYGSYFWLRDASDAEPRLVQLCGGYNFYEPLGIVSPTTEYLGPVRPEDFEQLAALREAGANALQWIVMFKELDHGMFHVGDFEVCREPTCIDAHELIDALREALGDSK